MTLASGILSGLAASGAICDFAIEDRWQGPPAAAATHTNLQTRGRHPLRNHLDRRLVSCSVSPPLTIMTILLVGILATASTSAATPPSNDSAEADGNSSSIEFVVIGNEPSDWFERLKTTPNVRKLTVRRPDLRHFKVSRLKELKQLTSFRAEDCPLESRLADMMAVNLAKLPNLRSLTFLRTGLTSRGLQSLRDSSLTELVLSEEEFMTDDGFKHVAKMPSLRRLVLDSTPINVVGLNHLQACSQLNSLALRRHPAGSSLEGADQRIAAIAGFGKLEELELSSIAYTRLVALKKVKSLKQLTVRRGGAFEASRSLKQLNQLDKIVLDNCDIRNETFDDVKSILAEVGIELVDATRQGKLDLLTRDSSPTNEATNLARQVHGELDIARSHPAFWVRWRSHSSEVPSMQAEPVRTVHRLKKALTADRIRRPYSHDTTMAWAPQQFYIFKQSSEDGVVGWEQFKYGGAKVAWSREARPEKPPRHYIRNGISDFIESSFHIPSQLRISQQSYWWGAGTHYRIATSSISPQAATYNERPSEELGGEACRVVESPGRSERLWISKETGRLRGHLSYAYQGFSIPFHQQDIVTQIAGRRITSREEYGTLIGDGEDALPEEKQHLLAQAWAEYKFDHAIPRRLHVFSDYREIAPGRWFPFQVQSTGWSHNDENQGLYDFYSFESEVIEVALDRGDLEEYWADVRPQEGDSVQDQRYGVPVEYEYRDDRTDDEIQELVNEQLFKYARSEMLIADRTSPIKKMVGKSAPPLPAERWIGDRPDVKGRRYLIHCWATWCAPCKNDVPLLNSLSKNRIVIGVHPSGTNMDEIRKAADDTKMTYPTAVAPPGAKDIFGYPVKLFPYCIEIDEDGNVAKHGSLNEVLGVETPVNSAARTPPNVSGIVLGLQPEQGFVAISLGEGDGIRSGHVLDLVRDNRRIAQVRIVLVRKTRCVGKIADDRKIANVGKGDVARVGRK